jgi:hypothetical protein
MNLRTRPSPADVDLIRWVVARADAGVVALAADFYDQFAETAPPVRARTSYATRAHLRDRLRAIDHDVEDSRGGHERVLHPYDFAHVGPALTDALASAFGSGWTPAVQEAWTLAYNLGAAAVLARGRTWVRLVELEAVA